MFIPGVRDKRKCLLWAYEKKILALTFNPLILKSPFIETLSISPSNRPALSIGSLWLSLPKNSSSKFSDALNVDV